MSKIIFFIFAFISFSCSTTNIKSKNKFPISFSDEDGYTKEINTSVTKEFFLWGLLPTSHDLYIDEEMADKGYNGLGNLVIAQSNTISNNIWTLLTFGVYWPQTYNIKGKSLIK